ncbi:Alpha-xylosidase [Diplonema papillatum]|nr:Alpha-xylosidase [Diplonema papillatum]
MLLQLWAAVSAGVIAADPSSCPSAGPTGGRVRIYVCAEDGFRVVHTNKAGDDVPETLVVVGYESPYPTIAFTYDSTQFNVSSSTLTAVVDIATEKVTFVDVATDEVITQEGRSTLTTSKTEPSLYEVTQTFTQSEDESLYGGGEFQNGLINWKDTPIDLVQFNTEAAVPFFVSTKGYGVLWEGYSFTHVNAGTALQLSNASSTVYTGTLMTTAEGTYQFLVALCPGGYQCDPVNQLLNMTLTDGASTITAVSWVEQMNIPTTMAARAVLKASTTYTITIVSSIANPRLSYNAPNTGVFSITSDASAVIDYYFLYGRSIDGTIARYRDASGIAPLYPKKAYGFWSSRNRYHNQSELLANAHEYRSMQIPIDSIVQDWLYWGSLGWGPQWDPKIYPDPASMVSQLHALDLNFMVSVWSKFDTSTSFYKELQPAGFIINGSTYYDPYSGVAREMYYNFSHKAHFDVGVDSLWMDATEPENAPQQNQMLALGPGNQYLLPYSLMTTSAVTEGLRRDFREAQGARVFTLTRSAFAGQQRLGAVVWSGDTTSTFDMLRRQVYASVNFQLSGIPYWSMDIGGFFRPGDQYTSSSYHNLLVRWFQFGAFTPIFRLHGTANTEPWNYGASTMTAINTTAIALRYRFLPYTYSGFHHVEVAGSTMQRAMVFDFGYDKATHSIGDQYMWGKSVLVAPVYTAGDPAVRSVYFPVNTSWVDFYTGETVQGGQTLSVSASLQQIPLYFRSGSIVPLGPVVQHARAPADPLEIRIVGGGDAAYDLYEDDGKSPTVDVAATHTIDIAHSVISFRWTAANSSLEVDREGTFPGMLQARNLNIYVVRPGHGTGTLPANPDSTVVYTGGRQVYPVPTD